MGDMSREPSMEDILSSIRRVIARDEAQMHVRLARATPVADVLNLDKQEIDPAPALSAAPAPAFAPQAAAEPEAESETLVSHSSIDAARQSLDALGAAFAAAPSASGAGRTIDDMVMTALRPMLKEWLDANLPSIVEAMVAKEIARIAGRE
jgi:cell pole-organizing protein PopZ